jgi:hypothetical protein
MGEPFRFPPLFFAGNMRILQDKQATPWSGHHVLRMRRFSPESDASLDLVVDVFSVLD